METKYHVRLAQMLVTGALLAASVGHSSAQAQNISFDFENLTNGFNNYLQNSFRFSPNCHVDKPTGTTGAWMGWDGAGCGPNTHPQFDPNNPNPLYQSSNSNFLGPMGYSAAFTANGWMYVDSPGQKFSLISVDIYFLNGISTTFLGSNGSSLTFPKPFTGNDPISLTFDNQWSQLDWVLISGGAAGLPTGMDNLVVQVPELGTFSAFGIGLPILLGVIALRRKKLVDNRPLKKLEPTA